MTAGKSGEIFFGGWSRDGGNQASFVLCRIEGLTVETASVQDAAVIGDGNHLEEPFLEALATAVDAFSALSPQLF